MAKSFTITAMERSNNSVSLEEGFAILSAYYMGRSDVNVRRMSGGFVKVSFLGRAPKKIHPRYKMNYHVEKFNPRSWELIKMLPR